LHAVDAVIDRALLIQRGRITRELSRDALTDPALMREFIGTGA